MTREEAIKKVRWGLLGLIIDKDVRDAFETLIPELAESEEERIRKELIDYLWGQKIYYESDEVKMGDSQKCRLMIDGITWLEKQKEQKPLSTEETELNSLAFLSQMGYTCIPPKKEHQNNSDAPKNALGGALNSPLDKDKNLDDIAQDYVEAVKEYNPEPTWDLIQTAVCYGYHYREEEEQKPAEWSDEDSDNLERVDNYLWMLDNYVGDDCAMPQGKTDKIRGNIQGILSPWLKSLPERFNLQPKQEWSEEEKDKLNSIERLIVNANAHGNYLIGDKEATDLQHFIRSIVKPTTNPAEWGEEDEKMIDHLIEALPMWANGRIAMLPSQADEYVERLKSLRPSWKPSEEDLMMLEHIIEQYETGNKNSKVRGYLPRVEELNFLKKVFEIWKN